MSNDYFKAQGWFKNYATSSEDSRGMFQQLVKEDEEAFRLASAETDRIKDMINEKFGPGTMKPASELPPVQNPFDDFEDRNPMAGIEDETREYYLKYLEDRPEGSKGKPIPLKDFAPEFIRENAAEGGRMGFNKGLDVKQIIVPNKTFNKKKIGLYNSRNKATKEYTGQPFVRDSTKLKPLPPNAVRSGESVIFLGENAQADAEKFLKLTKPKGGDLTELKRLINESNNGFKFVHSVIVTGDSAGPYVGAFADFGIT